VQLVQGPFTTAPGPRRQWSHYTIWAEDGLVFMEDKEAGEITVLTCNQTRGRLKAWATDEIEVWDKRRTAAVNGTEKGFCNDMYFKMKGMVEVLTETLAEAVNQGDQNDPEVAKKKLTAFMRARLAGKYGDSALPSLAHFLAGMNGATDKKLVFGPGGK
jgi:hypothetical protein